MGLIGCFFVPILATTCYFLFAFSLANCPVGQDVLGVDPTNATSSYTMKSSFVHVFAWLKATCDSQVDTVTFKNSGSNSSNNTFYLAIFEPRVYQNSSTQLYYFLINRVALRVPAGSPAIVTMQVPSLYVKKDQVFGLFYDYWNMNLTYVVVPYVDEPAKNYSTYIGRVDRDQIDQIKQLRVGAELESQPVSRAFAMKISLKARNDTSQTLPPNVGTCGGVPNVPFANVNFQSFETSDSVVGDVIEYACKPGYRMLVGAFYRVWCKEPEVWSELPECVVDDRPTRPTTTTTTTRPTVPTDSKCFMHFSESSQSEPQSSNLVSRICSMPRLSWRVEKWTRIRAKLQGYTFCWRVDHVSL